MAAAQGPTPGFVSAENVPVLFQPELHEPLTDTRWDDNRSRASIRALVEDADRAFEREGLWPAEEWDSWQTTPPLKDLYVGASGVLLALDLLRRRGFAETAVDLGAASRRTLTEWREHPDFEQWTDIPSQPESALFTGGAGPRFVAWRIEPNQELADELYALVRENIGNAAVEIMWGAPGTMLAARAMHEWTGDQRWPKHGRRAPSPSSRCARRTACGRTTSTARPFAA